MGDQQNTKEGRQSEDNAASPPQAELYRLNKSE